MVLTGVVHASAQQKAPDLSLKDIYGRQVSLSAYKGKVLLLNFWATWCVPCRTEIPDLIKKQREYRHQSVRIVGITYTPEKVSKVRSFVRKLKMNYPVVIGSKEINEAFTLSDVVPVTIVIDREGNIRGMIKGIMYSDEFEEKVKPLIGQ